MLHGPSKGVASSLLHHTVHLRIAALYCVLGTNATTQTLFRRSQCQRQNGHIANKSRFFDTVPSLFSLFFCLHVALENEKNCRQKLIQLNNRTSLSHRSRKKDPLVGMSASWPLRVDEFHLDHRVKVDLVSRSSATRLIVGLLTLLIILITLSQKMFP